MNGLFEFAKFAGYVLIALALVFVSVIGLYTPIAFYEYWKEKFKEKKCVHDFDSIGRYGSGESRDYYISCVKCTYSMQITREEFILLSIFKNKMRNKHIKNYMMHRVKRGSLPND